jgi:hypothetical protein
MRTWWAPGRGEPPASPPPQDAIDIAGSLSVLLDHIGPVRGQTACGNEKSFELDGRSLVPSGKRDDQIAIGNRQSAPGHDQSAIRGAREDRELLPR